MATAEVGSNDRKLLRIIVWASTFAVAGCVALMFGFDNNGDEFRYHFTIGSVVAFAVSILLMMFFWKRVFALLEQPKRLWRFIIASCVLVIVLFIAMIFLPRFRSVGNYSSDLLQGMILGFLAVAAVFYFAWKTMQLLEGTDNKNDTGSK